MGWTTNLSDTGVLVNGAGVTAYGLFVEHFQKFNVLWNGERGRTVFFQNEMPYDPHQAACSHDGVLGFAAYKVADNVRQHEARATGAYCFFQAPPTQCPRPRPPLEMEPVDPQKAGRDSTASSTPGSRGRPRRGARSTTPRLHLNNNVQQCGSIR